MADGKFAAKVAAVSGLLICGTGTALTAKIQYELESFDSLHRCRPFMIPWPVCDNRTQGLLLECHSHGLGGFSLPAYVRIAFVWH